MDFKDNLKRLRKEKNLSQEMLAKKLNISRQAISKWESGKACPDIDNLILLRDIFNVTLDELVINEKVNKEKIIDEKEDMSTDNKGNYHEEDEEEDEDFVNLMVGGFIIGTGLGVITENFMWGIVGAFMGMGIGYILEAIRGEKIKKI